MTELIAVKIKRDDYAEVMQLKNNMQMGTIGNVYFHQAFSKIMEGVKKQ